MQIGDLAKRLGVSTSKIRHLEAKGLLRPTRGHSNWYHMYDEETAVRLAMMLQAQNSGLYVEGDQTGVHGLQKSRMHAIYHKAAGQVK